MIWIGSILVGIWLWDELAFAVDTKTGSQSLPFIWKGSAASKVPEYFLVIVGVVLIFFGSKK